MSVFGGKRRDGKARVADDRAAEIAAGESAGAPARAPSPKGPSRPPSPSPPREGPGEPARGTHALGGENVAHIGKSISIHGELSGDEDIVIEGKVDGKVELPNNHLTIGQSGNVKADVHAKMVTVVGRIQGNVSASERVEIEATGIVDGDVNAARLVVQEGAVLNGAIAMSTKSPAVAARPAAASESKPGAAPKSAFATP